jgi:hypothetical protein
MMIANATFHASNVLIETSIDHYYKMFLDRPAAAPIPNNLEVLPA